MNTLLFPGQGSQVVGMCAEFYKKFEVVKKIFNRADNKLGYSISKIILEGPGDQLQLTKNTQPAILTASYAIFKILTEEYKFNLSTFRYFAGHSLGEYSALVCANSLNFEDAIYLLHERGKAMQEAVPVGNGSMIAILGTKVDVINDLIVSMNLQTGVCEIANDNAEGQVIISGDKQSVDSFQKILTEKKLRFIPLKVSAPFHCSLMKSAANNMSEKILNIDFKKPLFQIVSNVTAKPENDPKKIKELLINQIFSTVRWRESILNLSSMGVLNYIEIGPGKVLSGMVKRTIKNAKIYSINTIDDIEKLKNEFKE